MGSYALEKGSYYDRKLTDPDCSHAAHKGIELKTLLKLLRNRG